MLLLELVFKNTEQVTILVIFPSVLAGIPTIPWLQLKIYHKNFINALEGSFIFNVIILSIMPLERLEINS